jgi:hypothetical protein
VVAIQPDVGFLARLGIKQGNLRMPPRTLSCIPGTPAVCLRTVHHLHTYFAETGQVLVASMEGDPVWLWVPFGGGGILIVGTDLAGDLIRYRQGDPTAALNRVEQMTPMGILVEKPQYLFNGQLEGEDPNTRHADLWASALAFFVSERTNTVLSPILPGDAAGAIIMTGDDDQAALKYYEAQLHLLQEMPMTYFLHPNTHHTRATMATMLSGPQIDLSLHPDALSAPREYERIVTEQVGWFRDFAGYQPLSVRNHGFLNDGYWGHLSAWRANGIVMSSNITGHDGRVLNGSLLPARVSQGAELTEHWSILTAVTDGAFFQLNMSDLEIAERLIDLASRIRQSGIPGIIVLNLHPENVHQCPETHITARELSRNDFVAWTMRDCWKWFNARDLNMPKAPRISGL